MCRKCAAPRNAHTDCAYFFSAPKKCTFPAHAETKMEGKSEHEGAILALCVKKKKQGLADKAAWAAASRHNASITVTPPMHVERRRRAKEKSEGERRRRAKESEGGVYS